MVHSDTIVALATPPGESGIAVIRVSGPRARHAASAIFDRPLHDRRVVFGRVVEPDSGAVVDEAIAILMQAPRSFTREDVVELHCHGGALIVERVLALLLARGLRAAEPGEFTLRAFLNGRIDLAQAESVLDVIRARTDAAHRVAMDGLRGRLSGAVTAIRDTLLSSLAYVVARIDFPEEDVPEEDILPALAAVAERIERLIGGASAGALYRDGARVAIVGPPNAGKSSLLNRLLRQDRAIVTPVAGTTRDTLEEAADIRGIPVVLTDTAGLSDNPEPIEALGIERTHRAAATADAVLLVLDRSAPFPDGLSALAALAQDRPLLAILNKCDLPPSPAPSLTEIPSIEVSATRGDGIEALEERLATLLGGTVPGQAELLVANSRHLDALRRSQAAIQAARDAIDAGMPEDFVGIDLRAALDALGEITGETAGEDLLDTIFSRFCIGK